MVAATSAALCQTGTLRKVHSSSFYIDQLTSRELQAILEKNPDLKIFKTCFLASGSNKDYSTLGQVILDF